MEMATGFYFGLFPLYFELLKSLNFHSPDLLIIDILIACLALLLPTFLMEASIPLLTATLTEGSKEINTVHAKVYGWNTLGAYKNLKRDFKYIKSKGNWTPILTAVQYDEKEVAKFLFKKELIPLLKIDMGIRP